MPYPMGAYPQFQQYPQQPYPQQPYAPQAQPIGAQRGQEQPVHGFVYVHGYDGACAYPLPNGSEMPLFDNDADILYIKTVDQTGRMSIQVKDCFPHVEQAEEKQVAYVTQEDLRAVYREIEELRGAIAESRTQPAHAKE